VLDYEPKGEQKGEDVEDPEEIDLPAEVDREESESEEESESKDDQKLPEVAQSYKSSKISELESQIEEERHARERIENELQEYK
jgi:molecular chaperone GrpE (heat shock protein)